MNPFDRATIQPGDVLELADPVPIGKHPGPPAHMYARETLELAAGLRKAMSGAVYDVIEVRRKGAQATWIRVNDGWINVVAFEKPECRPTVR